MILPQPWSCFSPNPKPPRKAKRGSHRLHQTRCPQQSGSPQNVGALHLFISSCPLCREGTGPFHPARGQSRAQTPPALPAAGREEPGSLSSPTGVGSFEEHTDLCNLLAHSSRAAGDFTHKLSTEAFPPPCFSCHRKAPQRADQPWNVCMFYKVTISTENITLKTSTHKKTAAAAAQTEGSAPERGWQHGPAKAFSRDFRAFLRPALPTSPQFCLSPRGSWPLHYN